MRNGFLDNVKGLRKTLNTELIEKTERLREMMAREGLGGVLLNAQHNFAWLTGGRSNGIDT